ncbi:1,3-beta-glucan synthase subunit FKS1-like protein, partial [Tanacetum coccineum]
AWDMWTVVPKEDKEIWFSSFELSKALNDITLCRLGNVASVPHVGSVLRADPFRRSRIKGRAHKPPFMHQSVWQGLWTMWESLEFITKSDRGKAAWQSNKRLHVGGSVPITEHKRRLQKDLGRDLIATKLFFRIHIKKDKKTFIDNEAKETYVSFFLLIEKNNTWKSMERKILLIKKSGNIANTYIRWADHVGSKKGKFYGLSSGFNRYIENDLLKAEQERMKIVQEAHTQKLDKVVTSQNLLEDNLKAIQSATQKVLELLQRRQPIT